MYDELVKRLRSADAVVFRVRDLTLMQEAADAIESTSKAYQMMAEAYEAEVTKSRWIPVTERLPESGVHVLACCRVKWVGGGGRSYVCDAFYSAPKTEICSYNDDIEAEYDEETDEYYMPEGWWAVNSCVAIGDFVTHWMPLTEPPKEET